jgi:pimeloyl-ACP methyl ester carboxylesterase
MTEPRARRVASRGCAPAQARHKRPLLPVAVTVFPRDIPRLPRSWIEDTYSNLIHYGEADKGGHFAALEQPEILVSEIRTGLRTPRS